MTQQGSAPQRGGWSAGKIVLVSVLVLTGLGALCCGGAFLLFKDEVTSIFRFSGGVVRLQQAVQAEVAHDAKVSLVPSDEPGVDLALGVSEELSEERAEELQDQYWRIYARAFANGGFRVRRLGVGRLGGEGRGRTVDLGTVRWVSVDELVERTGVAAPPVDEKLSPFLDEEFDEDDDEDFDEDFDDYGD
jgi:hypothetical protein